MIRIMTYERGILVNSEKDIGLDVHQATISVAVLDSRGKLVMECILETQAATILEFFTGLRGTLSVTFEEGTWAAWPYGRMSRRRLMYSVGTDPLERVATQFGRGRTTGNKRECLRAAVEGPFFPDWEFGTIFGLERDDVKRILTAWPEVNEADDSVVRAINNSLNNLLGYPDRKKGEMWPKFISVTRQRLQRFSRNGRAENRAHLGRRGIILTMLCRFHAGE
jgi:hypothetical protein